MTPRVRAQSGFRRLFMASAIALLSASLAHAQTTDEGPLQPNTDVSKPRAITNDEIIRMTKAGLDEVIVLQTVQMQPGHYDVAPEDLITLKDAGVSARVILAMQAKSSGLGLHSDAVTKVTEPVPLALGIDEIGVYYKDKAGEWIPLKTERVVLKSGGWIKSALTHNIVKQDMNGHIEGPHSPLALPSGFDLIIYAPSGTDGQEYELLRLTEKKDSREFRTLTGGVFHSESGTQREEVDFNPKRVGPQMYGFTIPPDIEKGEYGVLPPGTSNMRGMADTGKIFTFSIAQ